MNVDGPESGAVVRLTSCPKCGCREMFVRKDFPQKLGLVIVVVAAAAFLVLAASRAWLYLGALVLLAAAAIDAVLYVIVPKITVCYRCRAEFRDVAVNPEHGGFELAVGEKYRRL
jgi:membrane protein YdbS with pleckstrin-like domain